MALPGVHRLTSWARRTTARRRRTQFQQLVRDHFQAKYESDGVISRHDMSSVLPVPCDDYEYRLYVARWAAARAAKASDGLFVAVGTSTGRHVKLILDAVRPVNPYWLIDAWDGRSTASDATVKYPEAADFEAVKRTFSPYQNVHLLRGIIPAVLSELPATKIAFAFFCLGDTEAEIAALETLLPRLDQGGIFILNGFGRRRTSDAQRRRMIEIAGKNAIEPLVMPTGHALLLR